MSPARIQALTDGIFAISMTLLVLGLDIPDIPAESTSLALRDTLARDWPKFEDYALSFFLLGLFWITHHQQFHHIKRVNQSFLWLNILVLMLVALVPFSTSVMASFDGVQIAALVFQANLLAIGLTYLAMWQYATADFRLVGREGIDESHIAFTRRVSLVVPGVSLAAMGLTFFTPTWSETVYIACPILVSIMRRRMVRGEDAP